MDAAGGVADLDDVAAGEFAVDVDEADGEQRGLALADRGDGSVVDDEGAAGGGAAGDLAPVLRAAGVGDDEGADVGAGEGELEGAGLVAAGDEDGERRRG